MKFEELTSYAKEEHERQTIRYNNKNDPKTKYTIFAKLIEEVGELSEAILTNDNLQRSSKLKNSKIDLEGELADVISCTLILAQELNVNMEKALKEKITKNKARQY